MKTTNPGEGYPSPAKGWFLVGMLTAAYILSFIDRYILGLLVQPIKLEFSLSDSQIGLLLSAFTFVYGFVGIFMGWLIDRGRRVWIVAVGMALWSAATVMTGLAKTYTSLFGARMGVGVGEATLSPAAFSIIGDSFPPDQRGKPVAVYSSALPLGAGIAALVAAGIIAWAKTSETQYLPFFGELAPWRFVLVVVGLPGLLFSLAFVFLREPSRRVARGGDRMIGNGFGDAVRFLANNNRLYLGLILLVCTMTAIAYSQQFLAAYFERSFGWANQKYGVINGISILAIGPANMLIVGTLSDRLTQRGKRDAPWRLLCIGFFIMVPSAALPFFMPGAVSAFAMLCVNTVGIGIVSAIGVTALLQITPSQIRGQVVAIYYLIISLFGSLGPIITGYLSSKVFGEDNIGYAIAAVPVIVGLVPLLLMSGTATRFREQLARMNDDGV